MATLVLLAGLAVTTMNVFLPVLPAIGDALGASDAVTQYLITWFLLATAVSQLFIGPLSDRYGRRPVLLAAGLVSNMLAHYAFGVTWHR